MKAWRVLSRRLPLRPPHRPRPASRPSLHLSGHLVPHFPLHAPARRPPSPGARQLPERQPLHPPLLLAGSVPAPRPPPRSLALAPPRQLRRELICPQLAQRGGGGWAGARARSMSRRRRPRAAPGRIAARGWRGSSAGPDPGRQRPPILGLPAGGPSPPVAATGRRGVRGPRVLPGAAVVGPGRGLPARFWGRAWRRVGWSPARDAEDSPRLHGAGIPSPATLRGTGGLGLGVAGAHAAGGRGHPLAGPLSGAPHGRGAGESMGLGAAQLEVSICSSAFWAPRWHCTPFGEELGVSSAFEGRRPGPGRGGPPPPWAGSFEGPCSLRPRPGREQGLGQYSAFWLLCECGWAHCCP